MFAQRLRRWPNSIGWILRIAGDYLQVAPSSIARRKRVGAKPSKPQINPLSSGVVYIHRVAYFQKYSPNEDILIFEK